MRLGAVSKWTSSLFLNVSIVLLLTTCAGREFHTLTILLKKKCFDSYVRNAVPTILKPLLLVVLSRSMIRIRR